MRLPNAHQALTDREKITEYLLNTAHRYGGSKARFFGEFGFELATWKTLAQALREHAQRHEVSRVTETLFGPRYEISGELYARARTNSLHNLAAGSRKVGLDSSPIILSKDKEK